ncbi:hypothetical protein [Actinoplanes sp. RD1]|uniref:hypothetical protein n=1 Tax=Actinoplanes sp. RD1 TaxID=3064538 RepID=UPI002740797D|nr:hypothetical protein [Actinoplanes sp. RD1]
MRYRPPSGTRTEPPPADDAAAWITGAVPDTWFTEPPEVVADRDEILIWGRVPAPDLGADAAEADRAAAHAGRIHQFREDTRDDRIRIARQVEHRYQRKVSWGIRCGDTNELFTHLSAPVMTRLRQPERQVLDTLVDAGVARSRSEALAWCVRLVGEHSDDWLSELRQALTQVETLRRRGPASPAAD